MNIPDQAFENPVVFIAVIGFLAVIFVLCLLLLARFGRLRSLTRDGIDFTDDGPKKKKSPHTSCRHRADVITVFNNRDAYKDRINSILTRELPVEIMNHAEDIADNLLSMLESTFLTLLKDCGIATKAEVASTPHFREYRVILEVIRPHLLAEARRMLRENGWIKKEKEGTWEGYLKSKVQDYLKLFTKKMNDYYFIESPTRTEVYDANMRMVNSIAPGSFIPTLENGLRYFLVIAKSHHKEIDELEEKMKTEFAELLQ